MSEQNKLALQYANKTVLSNFSDHINEKAFDNEIAVIKLDTIQEIFEITKNNNYSLDTPIFLVKPNIESLNLDIRNLGNFSGFNYFIRYATNTKITDNLYYTKLLTIYENKLYFWNIDTEILSILIKNFENEKLKEVANIIKKFLV